MSCEVIAIDGPAGAGKSSSAALLANRLGFAHLDTGATYRGLALAVLLAGGDPTCDEEVSTLVRGGRLKVDLRLGYTRVLVDGLEVTTQLRTVEITRTATIVAALPGAHHEMLHLQRDVAATASVVADGRDTTTAVFPDAILKVFLTASVDNRALRILHQRGLQDAALAQVRRETLERDSIDAGRLVCPMSPAPGALVLETDGLSVGEVVEYLEQAATSRLAGRYGLAAKYSNPGETR